MLVGTLQDDEVYLWAPSSPTEEEWCTYHVVHARKAEGFLHHIKDAVDLLMVP